MNIKDVQEISNDLNDRMAQYTHSMQPTGDEVSLALLLCHISDLEKLIEKAKCCLVCSAIGDPMEVCVNTLAILDALEVVGPHTTKKTCKPTDDVIVEYIDDTSLTVHYWPCGTWCLMEELEEYSFMSDDYSTILVPEEYDDSAIDIKVMNLISNTKIGGNTNA